MRKHVYIDLNPLINTGALICEAFTERGDGKTTALIKDAYRSWKSTGKTACVCRRFATEMGNSYLNDILEKLKTFCLTDEEAENLVCTGSYKKGGVFIKLKDQKALRPIFQLFPLSMAGKLKSGLDYATHRNLYIDEYIPLDGRYLPNEAEAILELYRTIDRDHDEGYILICGNPILIKRLPATDSYFDVHRNYAKSGLTTHCDNTLAILTHRNRGNVENVKQSRLGKLTAATNYSAYATGGALTHYELPITQARQQGVKKCFYVTDGIDWLKGSLSKDCLILTKTQKNEAVNPENVNNVYSIDPTIGGGYKYIFRDERAKQTLRPYFANGQFFFRDYNEALDILDIAVKLSKI